MAERADAAERERLWPRLSQECDRLEALISEILALARLDADPGAAQPVDLAALLGNLQEDVRLTAPQQQLQIDLDPRARLQGWPDMLERALDNLLRNALRFSPADQPVLISVQSQGQNVTLSVRDHGPGVASEYLEQLGKPFFRAPGQSGSGHGLGLAIARRAAQRHGGELLLSNHPQGGFIATLSLPARQQAG